MPPNAVYILSSSVVIPIPIHIPADVAYFSPSALFLQETKRVLKFKRLLAFMRPKIRTGVRKCVRMSRGGFNLKFGIFNFRIDVVEENTYYIFDELTKETKTFELLVLK